MPPSDDGSTLATKWRSKVWPDGCRKCHRTDVKHNALGLCGNCYKTRDGNNARLARDPNYDFDTGDASPAGGEPTPDEAATPGGDDLDSVPGGERRPGTFASPPGSEGGAPVGDVPKPRGRWPFNRRGAQGAVTDPAPKTTESRPRHARRRQDASDTLATGVIGAAWLVDKFPRHRALARCLEWQAVTTGELLDEAVRDTYVDRKVVQPIVKVRGRVGLVGAVLGPPAIVLAIEQNPQALPVLLPMLRAAVEESLPLMVPAMKRAEAKAKAKADAARELLTDEDVPPDTDPVDYIIARMFAGYVFNVPDDDNNNDADTSAPTDRKVPA